jgi:hypothetical protein
MTWRQRDRVRAVALPARPGRRRAARRGRPGREEVGAAGPRGPAARARTLPAPGPHDRPQLVLRRPGRAARAGGGELREWLNETQAASRYQDRVFVRPDDWDRLPNPDGLGTWAETGREVTFWLEYDTGTENLSRPAGKLEGYALLAAALASVGTACPPLLFCLPGPRREQSARRALAGCADAGKLRIATAAIDPRATCPAGQVWLPLGEASGPVRLIDLAAVMPDPWQGYRDERARKRREAIEDEHARLLEAGWDEHSAAELAERAVDQGSRR